MAWHRIVWLCLLTCFLGCVSTREEQARDYTADGVFLFERGQYLQARDSFQAALEYKPGDPGLLYNIGECHERQGDMARAEKLYNVTHWTPMPAGGHFAAMEEPERFVEDVRAFFRTVRI